MTIHPREVLTAFKPKLIERKPPLRSTAKDAKLVALRDAAADAQNHPDLLDDLIVLLGNILDETKTLQQVWALRGRVDAPDAFLVAANQ
jgi:hypothetical protein